MTQAERIFEIVKSVVEQQLAPAHVVDVTVREDVDHEGDEILKVEIVFEIEGDRLDPEHVLGLARHLREPLGKIQEERFPVFTFMKPGEMDVEAA